MHWPPRFARRAPSRLKEEGVRRVLYLPVCNADLTSAARRGENDKGRDTPPSLPRRTVFRPLMSAAGTVPGGILRCQPHFDGVSKAEPARSQRDAPLR